MRSLAFKELREVFAISVAALAAYLALVINLMGAKVFDWVPGIPAGTQEVPFTGSGFTLFFTVVSAVFAVARSRQPGLTCLGRRALGIRKGPPPSRPSRPVPGPRSFSLPMPR